MEYTFSIIKPDILLRNMIGEVITSLETAGFKIVAQKMVTISKDKAMEFYKEHSEKVFFMDLVNYISSAPCIVQVLKADNAISAYRNLMGTPDPKTSPINSLRYKFAQDITRNSVHGSDSALSATREIALFFTPEEITLS